MNASNPSFHKLVNKALRYAYLEGMEVENYTPTHICIKNNDVDIFHVNEYGSVWQVAFLPNCANQIFSYREFKSLIFSEDRGSHWLLRK